MKRPVRLNVAVVIPTQHTGRALPACLHSIPGQTPGASEVVVLDGWRSDATADLARGLGVRVLADAGGLDGLQGLEGAAYGLPARAHPVESSRVGRGPRGGRP